MRAGERFAVAPSFIPTSVAAGRTVTLVAGVSLAFLGAATAAAALVTSASDWETACRESRPAIGDCATTPRWWTLESVLSGPEYGEDPNPGVLYAAPLGVSAMVAGTTWALGTAVTDPSTPPWLQLVVGTLGGLAVYGALAALAE
ncbi:MAG: hypothetical protein HY791_37420 [Deltaproteobacteria bacterium]|nr:hypothetical protein [Deltaproteobacteria bacterium]